MSERATTTTPARPARGAEPPERFPEPGTIRSVEQLLAADIAPGERVYTHAQVVTTLGERGARLPLGLAAFQAGEEARPAFQCLPATTRVRMDVTRKVREATAHNPSPGYARAAFVAHSLAALGAVVLDGEPDEQRLSRVARLPFGDVAYAMYFLESLLEDGERVARGVVYTCKSCHERVREPVLDLGRRRVSTYEYSPGAPPRAVLRLRRPFAMGAAKKTATHLVLAPVPYAKAHLHAVAEDLAGSAEMDIRLVAAAIRGTQETPEMPPVTVDAIGEMHVKDQMEAAHVVSALSCEPGALLDHDCPHCGAPNSMLFSWVQPGFFAASRS